MDHELWDQIPYKTDDYERLVANVQDAQGRALLEAYTLVEQAVLRTATRLGYPVAEGSAAMVALSHLAGDDRIDVDIVPRVRCLLGSGDGAMEHLRRHLNPLLYIESALKAIHRLGAVTG